MLVMCRAFHVITIADCISNANSPQLASRDAATMFKYVESFRG